MGPRALPMGGALGGQARSGEGTGELAEVGADLLPGRAREQIQERRARQGRLEEGGGGSVVGDEAHLGGSEEGGLVGGPQAREARWAQQQE
ncbi:hypothetical protein ACN28S_67770 [Cystobacter fuscus]